MNNKTAFVLGIAAIPGTSFLLWVILVAIYGGIATPSPFVAPVLVGIFLATSIYYITQSKSNAQNVFASTASFLAGGILTLLTVIALIFAIIYFIASAMP